MESEPILLGSGVEAFTNIETLGFDGLLTKVRGLHFLALAGPASTMVYGDCLIG